jgi:hypothetical protein
VRGGGHLRERDVEGERGLGSLVFIHTVRVQAVGTATRSRIVKRECEIVATEEPLKRTAGLA